MVPGNVAVGNQAPQQANTTATAAAATNIAQTSRLDAADIIDDQPLYVNAKQYHRILKRRQQRANLEAQGKIPKERRVRLRICYILFFDFLICQYYFLILVFCNGMGFIN